MADLPLGASLAEDEPTLEEVSELSAEADAEPPSEEDEYEEQDDGSVLVKSATKPGREDPEFDENIAEYMDLSELSSMGRELCELIDSDKEDRKDRDTQYAEGIKRTGMGKNKNVGADFDGASSVVHPMLAKGCVDFASKAIKELFPSSGPVRTQIIGEQNDVKLERAERKKTYMNWQLTEQIKEHRAEFEKMLSQLPLGGSQYKRWWHDSKLGRHRTAAVYIDDIFLPYDQNDFYTSPRLTHREFIGQTEYEARVASGLYAADEFGTSNLGSSPERSAADKASREVEGVTDDSAAYGATGGLREMYTVYADLIVEEDDIAAGEVRPYIVHIEEYGGRVKAIYRNWAEDDKRCQKLQWIVEYNFIPWRGAYAMGLGHLIGSMSTASTGALNALLDSAHINNFPGAVKLKGSRTSGQTVTVNPTEIKEIDAPPGVDDIRKVMMALPFNGPSTVLYTLLEWLTQQAEVVVSTASEKIADAGANMPMGTALALIEGGSTNFSAIHARLHHSARRELEILHRLNATYLNDQETVDELGELVVYRKDFSGPMDVLPVSDPNIFSEAQRYAQLQAVMQLQASPQFAPFFKAEKLLVRALRLLQVPYAEEIANLPGDPKRLSAMQENSASADEDDTAPLKVYEDQDDLAHLESHVMFMTSPLLGGNPIVGAGSVPRLVKHCREHLVAYYRKNHNAASTAFLAIAEMQGHKITEAQAQSRGHAYADKAMANALSKLVAPGLEQAAKLLQQYAPKPPADGNVQAEIAAKAADSAEERKFKLQLQQNELAAQKQEADADREANKQATMFATQIEKLQMDIEHRTEVMNRRFEEQAQRNAEAQQVLIANMKANSDASLLVLKQLLADQAAAQAAQATEQAETAKAAAEAAPKAPDITELLQPLLEGIQLNAQQTVQQLAQHSATLTEGLQALHKASIAPRVAMYVKDENGNNVGVKSTIGE